MEFKFAKYTEITDYAFKVRPDYKNDGYVRFFICPDVLDYWFVRILEGYNKDYEKEEGCFVLERDKIAKDFKGESLQLSKLRKIIEDDCSESWNIEEGYDIDKLIDMLDDGFGILNLKSN